MPGRESAMETKRLKGTWRRGGYTKSDRIYCLAGPFLTENQCEDNFFGSSSFDLTVLFINLRR